MAESDICCKIHYIECTKFVDIDLSYDSIEEKNKNNLNWSYDKHHNLTLLVMSK